MGKLTSKARDGNPLELGAIVAPAIRSVHDLLDAIEVAAEAQTVYAEPWLMLTHLNHKIGERDAIQSLSAMVPGSKLIKLEPWIGASATAIARIIDQDTDGVFFKRVLDLAIILRARHAHGDSGGRQETLDAAADALRKVTASMFTRPPVDPYVVLNSAGADLALPENRLAAEVIAFADNVVSELYKDIDSAVEAGRVYHDGFVLMAFDKMTVGDPPEVGDTHFAASVAQKGVEVMLFGRTISASEVRRAFLHEEAELRIHLVTALICLRQLHERGQDHTVTKRLGENIASIKARLWFGANAI